LSAWPLAGAVEEAVAPSGVAEVEAKAGPEEAVVTEPWGAVVVAVPLDAAEGDLPAGP